jgi:1,4-dihydroxy-2-naphthoate octaprenyltransferase
MNSIKKWVIATRLETIPLALSSIGLGSALAAFTGTFDWRIGVLAAWEASLLQIVCNLANDYGDFVHGADPMNKVKPPSAIQTGLVTLAQVRGALPWLVGATVGCGVLLLYAAKLAHMGMLVFTFLGMFAVVAAITYTMGNKPYGYQGRGDVAVFIFFGLVGVGGTFYLHTQQFSSMWLLPAMSCGSLAVGILNVNNIRDLSADAQVGKNTIPVRFGRKIALYYHWCLLTVSVVAVLVFLLCYVHTPWPYACLCTVPLLLRHGMAVGRQGPAQLTEQLQGLVFTMLVFVVLLSAGLIL